MQITETHKVWLPKCKIFIKVCKSVLQELHYSQSYLYAKFQMQIYKGYDFTWVTILHGAPNVPLHGPYNSAAPMRFLTDSTNKASNSPGERH